jgi:hypothetical protein
MTAMAPYSRLARQLLEALAALDRAGAPGAIIGGLALSAYRVVRATRDVDLLTDQARADAVHAELLALGYTCLHRSDDAANYARDDERLDLLFAHRPVARELLAGARPRPTSLGPLPVISLEGLIAFKLQGYVNDPDRRRDLEDIRGLLRANRATIDLARVRDYFRLFDREALLDELLTSTG